MASKISEDLLSCQICFKIYDENERLPRVLPCGHTFCHSCLEYLFEKKLHCPNCSKDVLLDKPELIPINITLKNLISSINEKSELTNKSKKRKLQSIGYCDDHDNFKELRCLDCEVWICGMCASLLHKKCKTLIISEAFKELNKHFMVKLKEEQSIRNMIDDRVVETLQTLSDKRDIVVNEIKSKNDELAALEESFSKLYLIKSDGDAINEKLLHLQQIVGHLEQDIDSSSNITELDNIKEQRVKLLSSLECLQIHFPLSVKSLGKMCEVESVYAVDSSHRVGEDLYGEVRFINGRIFISSFKSEKPSNGRLIPLTKLLKTITKTTRLPPNVFLLLLQIQKPKCQYSIFGSETFQHSSQSSSEDSTEEDLYVIIKTEDPTSPRGKSLILLCSHLFKRPNVGYIGRTLGISGLYATIDGIQPILSGTLNHDTKYMVEEGDVFGMNQDSTDFTIKLNELLNDYQHYIGNVIFGLQELKTACMLGKSLIIKETGLVI